MLKHNNVIIANGTKAIELYNKKMFKELDMHIKKCLAEQRALEYNYEKPVIATQTKGEVK